MQDEKLSLAAAAARLDIPYSTVWLYWSQGKIEYERYGKTIVVKLVDVQKAMVNRKAQMTHTPTVKTA